MKSQSSSLMFTVFAIFIGYCIANPAAEQLPSFEGMLSSGRGNALFALKSPRGNVDWVPLGRTFDGFQLESYSSETETLIIRKNDQHWTLKLPNAKIKALRALSHDDALQLFNALISRISADTRKLITFQPLPPDQTDTFDEAQREHLNQAKARALAKGRPYYVLKNPANGVPMPIYGQPLDFERMPKGLSESLSDSEKADLKARYTLARTEATYNDIMARHAAGLLPSSAPGFVPGQPPPPGQRGTIAPPLPPEFLRSPAPKN